MSMQQPQFNPSRPQGTMANVVQTQGGGSHKPSVLGTLAGVGMGMATGNWAPLASHVLGSAAGGAMSAAQGSGTQTTGGETKSPGEGQPTEEGKKDSSMISGTGQVPEVGGGPVGQPQIQLPPEIHAALASMGFFGQPPGMALQQHAPQPMFGQPPMQGIG